MGSTLSSLGGSRGAKLRDDLMDTEDDEDEDPRPAKRRRITQFEFKGIAEQESSDSGRRQSPDQLMRDNTQRRRSKPEPVQPSDFYGSTKRGILASTLPRKTTPAIEINKFRINDILPKNPVRFTEAFRVDVVDINPSVDVENEGLNLAVQRQRSISISCRVGAAIFYAQQDETDFTELCRKVNPCALRVTVDDYGEISREFVKLAPFDFLPHEYCVTRKVRKPNGQWAGVEQTFNFADKYRLSVYIESTKSSRDWPPLYVPADSGKVSQSVDLGQWTIDDFHLYCKIDLRANRERQHKLPLQLCHKNCHRNIKQAVPYTLNLKVRWTVPDHLASLVLEEPKNESPRTFKPPTPVLILDESARDPDTPAPRRHEEVSVEESPANSRAQRHRTDVQTYNLKTLSTLAQGKSPRKRKPREPRSDQEKNDGLTVTYSFGKADAAESNIKQQTTVSGLRCPFCNGQNSTVEELRLHLHTEHGAFKFNLRRSPPRVQFFIQLAKSRSGPMLDIERSRIFQLGKPNSLFDLDKYLSGDDHWTRARHGPQHHHFPDHLVERAHDSSLSSSPRGSRYSSPNTSNGTDDSMDFDMYEKLALRPRKVFYVPQTVKPLYDAITKRVLQPGEEIPGSDDEEDEGWLHQKQRDLINDFTDVTAEEKDYINEWNPFIVEYHLTSDRFLTDAILRFAEAKKDWFVEQKSRKREFVKHIESFILRGVVDEKCLSKCIEILRSVEKGKESREKEDVVMEDVKEEEPVSKRRGLFICICGKFTQPPNRVVCTGSQCLARFFCRECAKKDGRPVAKTWKCNECSYSSA